MINLVGVAGSLRRGSFNAALLRAAQELMPPGASLEIGTIHGIPLYDFDVERQGIPEAVARLKDQIAAADGLLLVTPEYNNSIPGVFKNAIDWLSRPPSDVARIFGGRAVTLIGASPGHFGTISAQRAWLPVLRTLRTRPWFGAPLYVSEAGKAFGESGRLVDELVRRRLGELLDGYVQSLAGSARA
jgi:chromate reductase, NAD(P)H dehydrogenase (quinone)